MSGGVKVDDLKQDELSRDEFEQDDSQQNKPEQDALAQDELKQGDSHAEAPEPLRRKLKFSLQSMLLLMLACGLGFGWWNDHRRLQREIDNFRQPDPRWDTNQLLGPPNTPGAGDIPTAWASKTPDSQDEWIVLKYAQRVVPNSVVVHETYNPGALTKVTALKSNGDEVVLWEGVDPTPQTAKRGVSTIPVTANFRTDTIKIYLASKAVRGWNEIDAVGLTHGKSQIMWARRAFASSCYGRNNALPTNLLNFLP